MSKKRSSTTTSSSSSAIDPYQRAQQIENYELAKTLAAKPYQQYGGPTLAGFNTDQTNAFNLVRDGVANNVGGGSLGLAQQGVSRAMGYQPATVTGGGYQASTFGGASAGPAAQAGAAAIDRNAIRNVNGGSILDQDVGAYMNPYLQNVAANAMGDLDRTRQIQMMQGGNAATAAKAFGGSRHGVADAETNRNFFDVAGKTLTGLYSQGYDNALGLAGSDLSRNFQAQTANQGVDSSVASANAGFTQQANLANQSSTNNMAQFNASNAQQAGLANQSAINTASATTADADLRSQLANQTAGYNAANLGLTASNQMAALSDQERRNYYQDAALMEGVGGTQQAMTQREYDEALAKWQDSQNEDVRDLQLRTGVLNSMPILGQTSTGTSTATQRPSDADSAKQAIGTIGSIVSMFSDRNMKSGIKGVSEDKILKGLEKTPISSWQYDPAKGGPADGGARHTGPMAQDVKKNLGIGDGHSIPIVDAIGTQFAATKALAKKVKKLEGKTKKGSK